MGAQANHHQPRDEELPDYYSILQVDPKAEPEVIEAAYHRLARKYHPDLNPSPEAAQRMVKINIAYCRRQGNMSV